MKLVIFGATGGTGKCLVEAGLAAGHDVIAAARRPDAVTVTHDKLRVMKCDALVASEVTAALAGADAALSAIGPANNKQPGTLISQSIANIVDACTKSGVKRFVFESGLMVGDGTGLGPFSRFATSIYRRLNAALCADKRVAEATIVASALDYVIVRPPALGDREYGNVKSGIDIAISAAKKLGHADVATFMIEAAASPAMARTTQTIGR